MRSPFSSDKQSHVIKIVDICLQTQPPRLYFNSRSTCFGCKPYRNILDIFGPLGREAAVQSAQACNGRLPIYRVRISSWISSQDFELDFELDFRVRIFWRGFFWRFY